MGKSRSKTKGNPYRAVLAPRWGADPPEKPRVRYYASPNKAEAARKGSWAMYFQNKAQEEYQDKDPESDPRADFCNTAERQFIKWAEKNSLEVHRTGWPDFLTRHRITGEIEPYEVKKRGHILSPQQAQCAKMLEEAGLKTKVWSPRQEPVPWQERTGNGLRSNGGGKDGQQGLQNPEEGDEIQPFQNANLAPSDRNSSGLCSPEETQKQLVASSDQTVRSK